jgi:hypothetical protein
VVLLEHFLRQCREEFQRVEEWRLLLDDRVDRDVLEWSSEALSSRDEDAAILAASPIDA